MDNKAILAYVSDLVELSMQVCSYLMSSIWLFLSTKMIYDMGLGPVPLETNTGVRSTSRYSRMCFRSHLATKSS